MRRPTRTFLFVTSSLAFASIAVAVVACTGDDPAIPTRTDEPDASEAAVPADDAAVDVRDAAETGTPYYIFVSGGRWNGKNVGGLAAADAKCQTEAIANNYPGTYQAWLSDDDPAQAFPARVKGNGPWVDTFYNRVVFPDRASLLEAPLSGGVYYTSDGGFPFSSGVWTGTPIPGGDASPGAVTCNNWTADVSAFRGTTGQNGASDKGWARRNSTPCLEDIALVCLRAD